jgi:hypothetical protein
LNSSSPSRNTATRRWFLTTDRNIGHPLPGALAAGPIVSISPPPPEH